MNDEYLLDCPNYKLYLDSYVSGTDIRNIRNVPVARLLVQLNYRPKVRIYEREEFWRRKKLIAQQYNPEIRGAVLFSRDITIFDPLLRELAAREKPNLQKTLSTIIHLRYFNKHGFEISGFIDFADSLNQAYFQAKEHINWTAVFEQRIILRPQPTDISYFDWHNNKICFNETSNYAILHDVKGLMFMHRGDHKKLLVGVKPEEISNSYRRKTLRSDVYGCVVLYDHIIRKKI